GRHERPQAEALGAQRYRRQCHPRIGGRLLPAPLVDMVPEKDALPARRFCFVRQLCEQTRVTVIAEDRKINAIVHGKAPSSVMGCRTYNCAATSHITPHCSIQLLPVSIQYHPAAS